ncbi:tetratricopeptide repeat protein [Gynurincola endophyticus]|uniref:tetratricopeptide repeat protein n=1 Tax=Gynurincola endophyticus TaxID=2479004 RepID=UPI000F8D0476|nr:tetratricopeptide repeat protein [Gynurincola endophyticus]
MFKHNSVSLKKYVSTVFLLSATLLSFSQTQHNEELQKMADADQQSRMVANINWSVLNREDSLRRVRVFELIKDGQLRTGKDYLNAGIIFQHGNDTLASGMAVQSFEKALQLDSSLNRWWYAAAVDRDLMRKGQPQVYGTQFIKNQQTNGKFLRYTIDTTKVTDTERKYYGVETLAEQAEKERAMNLKSVSGYYADNKNINSTIELIKQEYKNGKHSDYDVSEEKINSFGYELLNNKKMTEALLVFELNTQLYPKGFNTFDSYGEALMLANQKKKALKAYKQSLKLNPENENARKILQKDK